MPVPTILAAVFSVLTLLMTTGRMLSMLRVRASRIDRLERKLGSLEASDESSLRRTVLLAQRVISLETKVQQLEDMRGGPYR